MRYHFTLKYFNKEKHFKSYKMIKLTKSFLKNILNA